MSVSGAEEFFASIVANGWAGLEAWELEARSEDYLLEFKGYGRDAPKLNAFDKANIGKSVSGFANASGGVLIIGVKTKAYDGADHVEKITPAPNVAAYAAAINTHLAQCTDPRVPGARAEPIVKPNSGASGVVAIVVPPSDGGPHRARLAKWTNDKGETVDHSDKYFHRQGAQTLILEHPLLTAMFGRRPPARLQLRARLVLQPDYPAQIEFRIINTGRGAAHRPAVQLELTSNLEHEFTKNSYTGFISRPNGTIGGRGRVVYEPYEEFVLYPGMDRVVGVAQQRVAAIRARQSFTLRGALYAIDMQPIAFEGTLEFDPTQPREQETDRVAVLPQSNDEEGA